MFDHKNDVPESSASSYIDGIRTDTRARDDALGFLEQHELESNAALGFDVAYMRRLRRKIDFFVIPLLLCYIMNFLDKILLNYSNVMGLTKNLNLRGNNFSNVSSSFFIAVLIFTVPNSKSQALLNTSLD